MGSSSKIFKAGVHVEKERPRVEQLDYNKN